MSKKLYSQIKSKYDNVFIDWLKSNNLNYRTLTNIHISQFLNLHNDNSFNISVINNPIIKNINSNTPINNINYDNLINLINSKFDSLNDNYNTKLDNINYDNLINLINSKFDSLNDNYNTKLDNIINTNSNTPINNINYDNLINLINSKFDSLNDNYNTNLDTIIHKLNDINIKFNDINIKLNDINIKLDNHKSSNVINIEPNDIIPPPVIDSDDINIIINSHCSHMINIDDSLYDDYINSHFKDIKRKDIINYYNSIIDNPRKFSMYTKKIFIIKLIISHIKSTS